PGEGCAGGEGLGESGGGGEGNGEGAEFGQVNFCSAPADRHNSPLALRGVYREMTAGLTCSMDDRFGHARGRLADRFEWQLRNRYNGTERRRAAVSAGKLQSQRELDSTREKLSVLEASH